MTVSIVIPCHNQARFLADAIDSALDQTNPPAEVIVVDDGSTDGTRAVAASRPDVTCIAQANQGLGAARNTGWRAAAGAYVVFLDADDRLLPHALGAGLACLDRYPRAMFCAGHYDLIDEAGTTLPVWRERRQADDRSFTSGDFELVLPDGRRSGTSPQPRITSDHYLAMLRRNYIGMNGAVMYRRAVLERTGGFDPGLTCLEDYEFYLRVTREHPVACHDDVVAQYRRHPDAMSRRTLAMLANALSVLHRQRPYLGGRDGAVEAYRAGLRFWKEFYGEQLRADIRSQVAARRWREASRSCWWRVGLALGAEPPVACG